MEGRKKLKYLLRKLRDSATRTSVRTERRRKDGKMGLTEEEGRNLLRNLVKYLSGYRTYHGILATALNAVNCQPQAN
jgi:hypothetical protein